MNSLLLQVNSCQPSNSSGRTKDLCDVGFSTYFMDVPNGSFDTNFPDLDLEVPPDLYTPSKSLVPNFVNATIAVAKKQEKWPCSQL